MAIPTAAETYGNRFLEPGSRSGQLFERARAHLPGGNTRTTVYAPPHPYYASRGEGCRLWDVDGQERLDFLNNYTSLLHGHAHPSVVQAAQRQLALGSAFAAPTETEIQLAEMLATRVPTLEQLRFTNSGTEAVMMAVKAARAFTGRSKIAKFEGCYHGTYDVAEVSVQPGPDAWGEPRAPSAVSASAGLAPDTLDHVLVLPFNDWPACQSLLSRHAQSLAAVLVDPLPHQAGFPTPAAGFLPSLRELTRRLEILLISDEIISFRLGYGGAHTIFDYDPELVTLGKIIGGGFPVGAVGGAAEVMAVFDPSSGAPRLPHGGTFNANPVTMAAGRAALELWTPGEIERLNGLGQELRTRANRTLQRRSVRAQFTGQGSLFRLLPTDRPVTSYRDSVAAAEQASLVRELWLRLLGQGIVVGSGGLGCLSTPMAETEVDAFLTALDRALAA